MQNDPTTGQAPIFSSVRSEAGKARVKAALNGFQSRPDKVQPSIPDKIAAVKASFDLTAVSPLDIDRMFDALVEAGQPVTAPMLLLNSMGAAFRGRLAAITGNPFDAARPMDLVAVAKLQIQRARKQGGSSASWEAFLAFLAPQAATPAPVAAAAPATPLTEKPTPMAHIGQLAQTAQTGAQMHPH
jgi:hypothetical protein